MVDATGQAIRRLRASLEQGRWPKGHRIPSERALAAELDVARNTLRQALDRLAAEGWIVREMRRGTFVRRGPDAVAHALSDRIANASPEDVIELRLTVEPGVAALAATRASTVELGRIASILKDGRSAIGTMEFEVWDKRLHAAIFEATRNPLLIDYCHAINAARSQPRWYKLKQKLLQPEHHQEYDRQHQRIVSAIQDREGEAARREMYQHLLKVREHLLAVALYSSGT